jgi:hypothetical protein
MQRWRPVLAASARPPFARLAPHLLAAVLAAPFAAGADEPSTDAVAPPLTRALTVRHALLPADGTSATGVALEVRRGGGSVDLSGDVLHLRDPRPGSEDPGMLLLSGAVGRIVAGGSSASLRAEAVGTLFAAVIGDVGVAAPGVGGGLQAEWRIGPAVALACGTRVTVPFPLADSTAGLRAAVGPLVLAAGWRDVRFLPVFGLPGRYASGPEASVAMVF